jgi:putative membrane protein
MKFLVRWLSIALAVAFALWVVPGIGIEADGNMWWTLLVLAAILGLVNATIGSALKFLSFPLMVLTLGLFNVVINALMLEFSAWLANSFFNTGFVIESFWSAALASIVISFVTIVMWGLFADDEKKKK